MRLLSTLRAGLNALLNSIRPGHDYKLPNHSDSEALASDWKAVGVDMKTALNQYKGL